MAAGLALLACAGVRQPMVASGESAGTHPSDKLTPFSYYEQGRDLFLAVDVRAARQARDRALLPLGLGIALSGHGTLALSRESFVLETPGGVRLPVVTHGEYLRDGDASREDLRLQSVFVEALAQHLPNHHFTAWSLFPAAGGTATVEDKIELAAFTWTHTMLYFPTPEGGARGSGYRLLFDAPELGETFVVVFSIE